MIKLQSLSLKTRLFSLLYQAPEPRLKSFILLVLKSIVNNKKGIVKKMSYQNTPPPPPPTAGTQLSTIKTYILIAFIFSIISTIAFVLAGLSYISLFLAAASITYEFGVVAASGVFLVPAIIFLVMMVFAILVFLRVWKLY